MNSKYYSILILTLIILTLQSQDICSQDLQVIQGIVRDIKSRTRLPEVIVSLDSSKSVVSDSSGYFKIQTHTGLHVVEARLLGYQHFRRELRIKEDELVIDLFIDLKPQPILLEKVTVTGERFKEYEDFTKYQIEAGDLINSQTLGEPDIVHAVQKLPGVVSPTDGSNLIYLRGGNFSETLIYLDGVPFYNQSHLGGIFSALNPDIVAKADLYPSNYPVEYGGALSGILDIKSKIARPNEKDVKFSLGLLSSRIYLKKNLKNFNFVFAARRTYLDVVSKLILGYSFSDYYFYDSYAKIGIQLSPNNRFNISGFYSKDVLLLPFKNTISGYSKDGSWGNKFLQTTYDYLGKNFHIQLHGYYSNVSVSANNKSLSQRLNIYNNNYDTLAANINDNIERINSSAKLNYITDGFEINAGLSLDRIKYFYSWFLREEELSGLVGGDFQNVFFDFAPLSFNSSQAAYIYSIFLQNKLQLTPKLGFSAGFRVEYPSLLKNAVYSFLLNGYYKLFGSTKLRLSIGRYFQYFNTRKDLVNSTVFSPFAAYFFSNDLSSTANSFHSSLGLTYRNNITKTHGEAEVYFKTRNQIPATNEKTQMFELANGYAAGIDILYEQIFNFGEVSVNYSFSRSLLSNGATNYFANHDRTHSFKSILKFKIFENVDLNFFWIYATGLPYTPMIGKYISGKTVDINSEDKFFSPYYYQFNLIYGKKGSARLRDFNRLDVGLNYSFLWGKSVFELSIQVFNIYNSSNPFNYKAHPEDTSLSQGEKGGFIIIPSLSLTMEF